MHHTVNVQFPGKPGIQMFFTGCQMVSLSCQMVSLSSNLDSFMFNDPAYSKFPFKFLATCWPKLNVRESSSYCIYFFARKDCIVHSQASKEIFFFLSVFTSFFENGFDHPSLINIKKISSLFHKWLNSYYHKFIPSPPNLPNKVFLLKFINWKLLTFPLWHLEY